MVISNAKLIQNPRRQNLLFAQSGRCFYCGCRINSATATRDHLVPRLMGKGKGARMNIVLACRGCNERKASRPPTQVELSRARRMYAGLGKPAFEIG